jgi:predicted lipid-binding transport protein (Tim44 family)
MRTDRLIAFAIVALLAPPALADTAQQEASPAVDLQAPPPATAPLYQVAAPDQAGTGRIFTSALYGGLAGALVGGAVALIEGGNYGRDIAIGAGVGILVGAALGAANVFGDARPLPASDGLNTTERFPVIQARTIGLGGRF